MIILFIVIANEVIRCLGARYCDTFDPVALTRMWELGTIEVMFEGLGIKIYRMVKDKLPVDSLKERLDKRFDK